MLRTDLHVEVLKKQLLLPPAQVVEKSRSLITQISMGAENMSLSKEQNVNNGEAKTKQKRAAVTPTVAIRIRHKSKARLEQLLRQVNKDRPGRKVKADDLIGFGLEILTDQHLAEICDKMLSNKDRMELLFQRFSKERRGATREEFLGALLDGKLAH